MKKIGLYFGSFNPIHNGHLIVAQSMLNSGYFDKIRFVPSPQNPFKNSDDLWDDHLRLQFVREAIADHSDFEISDIEFSLPKPSYTIQTLRKFKEIEPENTFSLIMGSDNLEKLHEWNSIGEITNICNFHIFMRRGSEFRKAKITGEFIIHENTPFIDISATLIRELIEKNKSIRYLVPENVFLHFYS